MRQEGELLGKDLRRADTKFSRMVKVLRRREILFWVRLFPSLRVKNHSKVGIRITHIDPW